MKRYEESMKEYTTGYEKEIIKLHAEVFNSGFDIPLWKWKFMGNPQGESWITLAQVGSEVVGQYCIMRQHLNFIGREIVSGQSCDTMIKLDQRGKGWFLKLANRNYRFASGSGAQAVFGFPNRNSYPGFMKQLDWVRLFNLNYYYCRLGLKNLVGNKFDSLIQSFNKLKCRLEYELFLKNRIRDIDFFISEKIPQHLVSTLREINTYEVLSIWKDIEYLKWRYENHPKNKYRHYFLTIRGVIEALIVVRICEETICICEVLNRTKNVLQTILLLYHVIIHSINIRAQKIDFCGYDNGFFDSVFKGARFKKEISGLVFGGRAFGDHRLAEMFKMPNNWSVSRGDIDVM